MTTTIAAEAAETADVPRQINRRSAHDRQATAGSALGALAIVWFAYQVLQISGFFAGLLSWYVVFLVLYATVLSISEPAVVVRSKVMVAIINAGAFVVGLGLVSAVVYTFANGWRPLLHWNFFTHDMGGVAPTAPLTQGGIAHAIVGTGIEVGIAVLVSLPLGLGTAIYLSEVGGRVSGIVRIVVEAMTALPSIVAGLFIYTVLIVEGQFPRTGFTAAMALSVMMIPVIARSAEVTLRLVPGNLREASMALGSSQWHTVWKVVLPTARSGLATALILGVARAVGETSPVLLTSGASTYLNWHPFRDPMNSLPLYVFTAVRSGEPVYIQRAFGAASVLLILVLVLFIFTRFLARERNPRRRRSSRKAQG